MRPRSNATGGLLPRRGFCCWTLGPRAAEAGDVAPVSGRSRAGRGDEKNHSRGEDGGGKAPGRWMMGALSTGIHQA